MKKQNADKDQTAQEMPFLNEAKIRELCELDSPGEPPFFASLADIFLNEAPPICEQIEQAFEAKDWDRLRRAAHKLKGMCSNLGADALAMCCRTIEEAAAASLKDGVPEMVRNLKPLFLKTAIQLSKYTSKKVA